ncbi:hypothetical protein DY000_02044089 [Brassica cretica]|uniref:Protein kinase domain-containing protein n=1 Tax=Brassica cretica TaxID=69181 RepID=A0ABQ7BI28_BRACR|nr:hypothetical protein DY000_02044089 [Brassica cretica]
MSLDSVKAMDDWQSNRSNELNKRKKKNNVRNSDGEEEEANGCWVKLRVMLCCVASTSDVHSSLSLSTTTVGSKSPILKSSDQPATGPVSSTTTTSNAESSLSTPMISEELKIYSHLKKFSFIDLKLATRNFRPESLLGEGGFGCVFKGWVEENGTAPVKPGTGLTVAVKTLNPDGLQGHKEWLAEINYLGNLLHPNLVKLVGYCIEDDQRLLVYEFMPRGSLENHLFRSKLQKILKPSYRHDAFCHLSYLYTLFLSELNSLLCVGRVVASSMVNSDEDCIGCCKGSQFPSRRSS